MFLKLVWFGSKICIFLGVLCTSLFCYAILCVHSKCNHLEGEEAAGSLLLLSYSCIVTIDDLWLFLKISWVCLQCEIVVFPYHIHLLFINVLLCVWTGPCATCIQNEICV